jgi:hypothetical protein
LVPGGWYQPAVSATTSLADYFIGSIGRKTEAIATVLFEFMVKLIYRKNNPPFLLAEWLSTMARQKDMGLRSKGREFIAIPLSALVVPSSSMAIFG